MTEHAHAECPDCHALVADLDAHTRWHGRVVADIAHAVDKAVGHGAPASH